MGEQGTGMTHSVFDVAIADGIAHLKLNRPDRLNSMNREFWNALPAIVRDIDDNARARVIVMSSTGKHFSAGMDLEVFADNGALASAQQDPHVASEAFRHLVLALQGTFSCLDEARISRDRGDPGWLHRRRGRHDVGLRYSLLHGRRILLHPGDQSSHDG